MRGESGNHLTVYENGDGGKGLSALGEGLGDCATVLEKCAGDLSVGVRPLRTRGAAGKGLENHWRALLSGLIQDCKARAQTRTVRHAIGGLPIELLFALPAYRQEGRRGFSRTCAIPALRWLRDGPRQVRPLGEACAGWPKRWRGTCLGTPPELHGPGLHGPESAERRWVR